MRHINQEAHFYKPKNASPTYTLQKIAEYHLECLDTKKKKKVKRKECVSSRTSSKEQHISQKQPHTQSFTLNSFKSKVINITSLE